MTTELARTPSAELIAQIQAEHGFIIHHGVRTFEHMIRCGELLIEAQTQVPKGTWGTWAAEVAGIHRKTASTYIRFARHAEVLRARGVETSIEARKMLAELNLPRANSAEHYAIEAQRMRKQGMTLAQIGEYFGVSHARVSQWIDHKAFKRKARETQARRTKALRVLEQKENAQTVKRAGKEVSEAYAHVRKALDSLSRVGGSKASRHIARAVSSLHEAEDHIVNASRGKA